MGQCVLREWVGVGYMGTSGNMDCQWACRSVLAEFHRGCIDYFSRQCVPKWDSPNAESVLATSLLVKLIGVALYGLDV